MRAIDDRGAAALNPRHLRSSGSYWLPSSAIPSLLRDLPVNQVRAAEAHALVIATVSSAGIELLQRERLIRDALGQVSKSSRRRSERGPVSEASPLMTAARASALEQYEGQWVAIRGGEVAAVAPSRTELRRLLDEEATPADYTLKVGPFAGGAAGA